MNINPTGLHHLTGTLSSGTTIPFGGLNIVGNIPISNANWSSSISITNDAGRIQVDLEDLVKMGRTGYLVKIMNLTQEDKKWLKEQLDTESVDLI